MKLSDHSQVIRTFSSYYSTWPDVVVQRILVVETTMPLSQKQVGYDQAQLESLIEAVGEHMEKVSAEKAEIFSTDGAWGVEFKNPAPKRS